MNRDVTLDKIEYLMHRAGDDDLHSDDLEEMIFKTFISSFEFEHGFEADLIRALVHARAQLREAESVHDDEPIYLTKEEVESVYCEHQAAMYQQAGYDKEYADESVSWPDALPLDADWDRPLLCRLARQEVAHHLVVMEQIRHEMTLREQVL